MTEQEAIKILFRNYEGLCEVIPHAVDAEEFTTFKALCAEANRIEAEFGLGDTLVLFVLRELADATDGAAPEDLASTASEAIRRARNELIEIEFAFDEAAAEEES